MISLPKGGNPAERNPNVGPIGETWVAVKPCVERQVWVQEIAVWVQETASVAYGWVGAVMEGFLVQWKWLSRCWRYSVVVVVVAELLLEAASVAYGWVGAVMEGFLVQWK